MQFLPRTKASTLTFGYLLDAKSYPGEQVLYVVDYTEANHSGGVVFAVFFTLKDGNQVFNIQNNAKFTKKGDDVEFVDPPLGGTWTQQHLISAIKQIELSQTVTTSTTDLITPAPTVHYESYADGK